MPIFTSDVWHEEHLPGIFSEDLLDDIRNANPILEVVSEFLPLKKSGRNYKGLCPFHSEKTPSFMVNPERQIFHCFGCGEGGNAFGFLMKYQNLTFPEAVRQLAKRGGVSLPERIVPVRREESRERDRLREAVEAAGEYYRRCLAAPSGKKAREYLQGRGLTGETIEAFGLGYAPAAWDTLARALRKRGFTDAELARAGLTGSSSRGGTIDRFRGRIIFPIRDLQGRLIAFGGRILGDGEPKYLNSPETPLYHKGKVLYGLYESREALRREGFGVIVEGYFDSIAAHQAGFCNTVATSGTALTEGHLGVMRRYGERWTVVFDGDAAGVRAAKRSLALFVEQGLFARGVLLPGGEDPDTFIRTKGAEAYRALLEGAESLMEFFVNRTVQEHRTETVEGKVAAVREIVPLLAKVSSRVEQAEYVGLAAHRLGVKEEVLWSEVQGAAPRGGRRGAATAPKGSGIGARRAEEVGIVKAMLAGGSVAAMVRAEVAIEDIQDADCRAVAARIFSLLDEGVTEKIGERLQFEEERLNRLVASWLVGSHSIPDGQTAQREARDCLTRMKRRRLDRESRLLQEKIAEAERTGNRDVLHELLRIKQELRLQAGPGG